MATFNFFDCFFEDINEEVHNLGSDQLAVALTNTAPTVDTDHELGDITEIDTGGGYTQGTGYNLTTSASAQSGGVYKLTIADLIITASGTSVGPFRYVVIFNQTAANDELIGYVDYGSALTLADGETLTLDFDGTNGLLQAASA